MPSSSLKIVRACAHRHHHFFQRGVPCPFAQAVDGAFDLARAADGHAGQRVGDREAKVVVAVDRPDGLVRIGNALAQAADGFAEYFRHRIADRVGEVDGGRAFGDNRFQHAAQEVFFRAAAVFRAEFDVVGVLARVADSLLGLFQHLFRLHAQLDLHVQRRGGDEGVDALARAGSSASAARAMSRSLARDSEQMVESLITLAIARMASNRPARRRQSRLR